MTDTDVAELMKLHDATMRATEALVGCQPHLRAALLNERNGARAALESALRSLLGAQAGAPKTFVDVIFDGPPSHKSGRFVEVEDHNGKGFNAGEWIERPDGLWALRIKVAVDHKHTGESEEPASGMSGDARRPLRGYLPPCNEYEGLTLRDAIDAAIAAAQEGAK